MTRRWILATALLLGPTAGYAANAVEIQIRLPQETTPETQARLNTSKFLISKLLVPAGPQTATPAAAKETHFRRFSPAGFDPKLSEKERGEAIAYLKKAWGDNFTLIVLPEQAQTQGGKAPATRDLTPKINAPLQQKRIAASLNVGTSRTRQNLYYDNAQGGAASASAPVRAEFRSRAANAAEPVQKGLKTKSIPTPAAKKGKEKITAGRIALETVKGAGEVVKSLFSWRGLATAVAAVAIVTVAPVAVYGFLALGAAVGGYTIGKAIYDGVKGYRKGNAEEVYAASREFGKGALTLGLSLYGARHAPTSLKPHIPKPSEYKALLASCDDEAIVITSLLQKLRGKPAAAH